MILRSSSVNETKKIAKQIAKKYLKNSRVFTLSGELGVGKTTFVQGFAQALGIKDKVISPTFVIIREHKLKDSKMLYHVDLYRLEDTSNIGLEEMLKDPNSIVLVEWSEKLRQQLPKETTKISIKKISENGREILVEYIT